MMDDTTMDAPPTRKQIFAGRRAAAIVEGRLSRAFADVMRMWDEWRAAAALPNGTPMPSMAERLKGLEAVLRDVWPFTREWKYLCSPCEDNGAVWKDCPGDQRCGRQKTHLAHTYVEPCHCDRGRAFREKPRPGPEDFTAATRSKPMTRMGR
jgi:hypothetical protein